MALTDGPPAATPGSARRSPTCATARSPRKTPWTRCSRRSSRCSTPTGRGSPAGSRRRRAPKGARRPTPAGPGRFGQSAQLWPGNLVQPAHGRPGPGGLPSLAAGTLSAWPGVPRGAAPASAGGGGRTPSSPRPSRQGMILESASASHPGLVRPDNEDALAARLPEDGGPAAAKGALFGVADGVGGSAAGEVASREALDTLVGEYYSPRAPHRVEQALRQATQAANLRVFHLA